MSDVKVRCTVVSSTHDTKIPLTMRAIKQNSILIDYYCVETEISKHYNKYNDHLVIPQQTIPQFSLLDSHVIDYLCEACTYEISQRHIIARTITL